MGDIGTILASTDGGVSWKTQSSGTKARLSSIQFLDPRQGWAVGDSGTILASTDGGVSWSEPLLSYQHYPPLWYYGASARSLFLFGFSGYRLATQSRVVVARTRSPTAASRTSRPGRAA